MQKCGAAQARVPAVMPGAMGEGFRANSRNRMLEKAHRVTYFVQPRTVENDLFQNTNKTAGQTAYLGALAV
jgi:hypothetical protein